MSRRDYFNTSILTQRREIRRRSRWYMTTLQWALLVSVGVHVLLLTIRFVDPERFNRMFQDTPL